ncbi:MAG: PEGA domain-containing protein [Deltaproteobacteria bacterium]|nr:PEGA domain-containing protein [Deltaproteobacteria bacterium]
MTRKTLLLVVILILGHPGGVSAQNSTRSEYLILVKQAINESKAERWQEARALFLQAHEISPNAQTLRGIGLASFKQSDYVSTIQYLQQALEDERKPLNKKQLMEVEDILSKAHASVGRVKVVLTPAVARLSVDGVAKEIQEGALLVNPGRYELTAESEGYQTRQVTITVSGGDTVDAELTLDPIVEDTKDNIELPIQASPDPLPEEEQESSPSLVPYVVMAAGGALLIGSGVTGMLSYLAERELNEACDSKYRCDKKYESTIERGKVLQVVSFVLLGTGVATAVTGVVLWLTTDSERESPTASRVSLHCDTHGCLGSVTSKF